MMSDVLMRRFDEFYETNRGLMLLVLREEGDETLLQTVERSANRIYNLASNYYEQLCRESKEESK